MDPRSRHHERLGLKIKTAGGFVGGNLKASMPDLLRKYGIETLRINQHTDCGAMAIVHSGVKDRKSVDGTTYNSLVKPFMHYIRRPEDEKKLPGIAMGIQICIAAGWKKEGLKKISCSMSETVGKVEGPKTLLLTAPFFSRSEDLVNSIGLSPERTYIITLVPGNIHRMSVDPKIAVRYLGINNVVLYKNGSDDTSVIERFWHATRSKRIDLGAKVERID